MIPPSGGIFVLGQWSVVPNQRSFPMRLHFSRIECMRNGAPYTAYDISNVAIGLPSP